jgi:hypothetical protein
MDNCHLVFCLYEIAVKAQLAKKVKAQNSDSSVILVTKK